MSQVVNLASERKARRSHDEAVAEYIPLANGGIAVVMPLEGIEYVWEFDREQTEILIRALTLAFVAREAVKVVQPLVRSAA
jgi:hypothetical protein